MEHENKKQIPPTGYSTKPTRFSDKRTREYQALIKVADSFADDMGGWDSLVEGQRVILGLLALPLRSLNDIRVALDKKESTVDDGQVDELLGIQFQKLADLTLRLVKEYYGLSGKRATKKRLQPITEIIEGSKCHKHK